MLFNSIQFVFLVVVTTMLFYIPILRPLQSFILIIASFIFYASNEPILLLLLLFSISINILTSYFVYHGEPNYRKAYAALGVVLNLGILAFFKYSPLGGRTFFTESSSLGNFLLSIPLPIGISFFTFQGITLLVDTLRNEDHRRKFMLPHRSLPRHALNTSLYIGFFPQLIAGPIVKAHEFIPQIKPKFVSDIDWEYCFRHLLTGYFFKMVVADSLKDQTFWLAYPYFEGFGSSMLLMMLFAYSMQIFADFAGYSLIAIGTAGLFGYRIPENFNFPYISRSLSEFWRRWHISLSSFLKEYLYFSLGGNRKGNIRTYINLMVVMLLGGLWHGAAWSYMIWGGFHGVALATERFFSGRVQLPAHPFVDLLRIFTVFIFITFAWLLFKLPEFSHVILFVKAIVNNTGWIKSYHAIYVMVIYCFPVIIYHLHYLFRTHVEIYSKWLIPIVYGAMLFLIITNSASAGKFVYFQF
jgi:alginate O-acetyltransferase complex protein AlgI